MGVARLRRLSAIFVILALVLPIAPELLGFPLRRGSCLGERVGGEQCVDASLILLALAIGGRAWAWSGLTDGQRRWTWTATLLVTLTFILLPLVPIARWYWDALR